jgi:phospholipid/cholesterol/gamma-HCH transport system permease protein
MFRHIGELIILFLQALGAMPSAWRQRAKVKEQMFEIGNASLLMVCILSLFIGGVVALNTGPVLVSRGLGSSLGGLVGISVCKELAPVMMAILIAGRIGSSMAAEIGSMKVNQEIDALRTMNINPLHYLVVPRMLAVTVALPMLVIFSMIIGWLGGAFVSNHNPEIHVSYAGFFNNLRSVVDLKDVFDGLVKSLAFAVVIGLVSCQQGLATGGGPRGVGRSVTKAVVNSIVLILLLDYFLTRLLMAFD